MKNTDKEKNLETCLVIVTGLIIFWFIYKIELLLIIAAAIGVIGAFFNSLAHWINWFWYKLADILGFVVSKILLSAIFYVFLVPLALFSRLISKNPLQLKKTERSTWIHRDYDFSSKDLENTW